MTGHTSMDDLFSEPYKRWYQFGPVRGPRVLYARTRNKHKPIFRARMMWQRARYGISDEDAWSLDHYLATVTVRGVSKLREWAHGHPTELSAEQWDEILAKIEDGFQTWIDYDGWIPADDVEAAARFKAGMLLYQEWFGGLWD